MLTSNPGGNRGIGLDVARGLAEAGAHVAIIHSSPSSSARAKEAAANIAKDCPGSDVRPYQADVADHAAIEATIKAVARDFRRLDVVVANAGICNEIDALDYPPGKYRELMSINLDGAFYTAQAAARVFKQQQQESLEGAEKFCGNIIFTTSLSAVIVNRPESQAIVSVPIIEAPG